MTHLFRYAIIKTVFERKGDFMRNLSSKQRKYLMKMFTLIFICEILLKTENRFFQLLGILLVPFFVTYGVLLLREDGQNGIN